MTDAVYRGVREHLAMMMWYDQTDPDPNRAAWFVLPEEEKDEYRRQAAAIMNTDRVV